MKYIFTILFLLTASTAFAESAAVEISAAKELEWNRTAKTYTARGSAIAKQGNLEVSSDTLTAEYREGGGGMDVYKLTAHGNVVIKSAPYSAFGDKAVYNVAEGSAVLTGNDLRISTADETITAKEKIEFFRNENRMIATGGTTATRGTDTLSSQTMSAYFAPNSSGKLSLQKITADGGVTIKTAKETVTGDTGIYDVAAQKATLTGKIIIRQTGGIIEGTRAEVDLRTGISKLFGGAGQTKGADGRVKGTFYPKAKN